MAISMNREEVMTAKGQVDAVKEAFASSLDTARGAVDDLFGNRGLEGQAAEAFRGQFDNADNTFKNSVIPQIEGIAQMLVSIADGLEESDLSIAQGMSGGG